MKIKIFIKDNHSPVAANLFAEPRTRRINLPLQHPLSILRKFTPFFIMGCYLIFESCKLPAGSQMPELKSAPSVYKNSTDTTNSADIKWREFFNDKDLITLIEMQVDPEIDKQPREPLPEDTT